MTNQISIISKSAFLKNNKKPNQRKVWDSIGKSWNNYITKEVPIVRQFLKNKTGKVIDLGCGSGRNMLPGKKRYYYEVDFSKKQIDQAKKYAKQNHIKAKYFKEDITELPKKIFKDNKFDYGLMIASLHCIESGKKRESAVKELYRALKKNGEALITVWNAEDERFSVVQNRGPVYLSFKDKNKEYMRFYYLYKKEELLQLLTEVGFTIKKFYQTKNKKDRFARKNWIIRVKK